MDKIDKLFSQLKVPKTTKRRFRLYDFQELGLFIATKVQDYERRSFYIKLAKYEFRPILMAAYSYAMLSRSGSRAATFLWRLKKLKEQTFFRLFLGIFFRKDQSIAELKSILAKYSKKYSCASWTPVENIHMTLFFHPRFPALLYPNMVRVAEAAMDKYGNPVVLTPTKLISYKKYIWLTEFNRQVFRYYGGLRKIVLQDKRLNNLLSDSYPPRFLPHITLARLPRDCSVKLATSIDVVLEGYFSVAVSNLTSKGPEYKIHPTWQFDIISRDDNTHREGG